MLIVHASALGRIMPCVGSVGLVARAPKPEQLDDAKEGEAFHHFAAELAQGRPASVGDKAPNGIIADDEMIEHANDYVATLINPNVLNRVEVSAHWSGQPIATTWEIRGKADLTQWDAATETLAITDAKYGFRYVDAEWNWQLLAYAIGTAMALGVQPKKFILAIYQPRGGGEKLRYWEATPDEVFDAYRQICAKLDAAVVGASDLATGNHCRHCPAMAGCPAFARAAYNAIDVALISDEYDVRPETMRARLDLFDRAEEVLKQYRTALEGSALFAIRNGEVVPGLSTRPQLGNTAWREDVTVQTLREAGNNYIEEKPVTPAEAKRRGMSAETYDKLTHRPSRGVKLVRADAAETAASIFGGDDKPRRKGRAKK